MKPPRISQDQAGGQSVQALRRRAEDIFRFNTPVVSENAADLTPEGMRQLLHELQVHQIELAMQNDELRRTQAQLEASRARYFDLYDLAPVGYCTVSESGLILEVNLTAANLVGTARADLVKHAVSQFILKADQDVYYQCRKQLFESGSLQSCELRMLRAGGVPFWVHLAATVAQDESGAPVLRMTLIDITERKNLDHALLEKNLELAHARTAADKANQAKSDFLASMSHELRSPLNAILGFAQLLESGLPEPTPAQRASIGQILRAGWYLLELINEVLDLALIESGNLSMSVEPISLSEVLLDCQTMIESQAQDKGISLCFPAFDPACFIAADRIRIKQVLINLLSNAIKYNRSGGSVALLLQRCGAQRLRISVQDSGAGLSPPKLAQLFQLFNRLGQETGTEEGTGIGLVVSKRLVELMGGAIGVHSTVGVGSVFWIELNLAAPATTPDADWNQPFAPTLAVAQAGTIRRTLLYVEDNLANRQLVEQIIARRTDLTLLHAADGLRGIVLARQQQPDLILMDINLPGISGIQTLALLRDDPATADIPVFAISANAMPNDIESGLAAGFYCYLTKPIKVESFMAALDAGLAMAKQAVARKTPQETS